MAFKRRINSRKPKTLITEKPEISEFAPFRQKGFQELVKSWIKIAKNTALSH